MKIEPMKMVRIHYTLKGDDGGVIDSSAGGEPLEYMHGVGALVPGLERQIEGADEGAHLSVVVTPAEGYGEYDAAQVQDVPRAQFDVAAPIEVGQSFQADSPSGAFTVRVVKVTDDTVTVDANHELAGKTLHFDIDVVDVRDPTSAERAPYEGGCGGSCSSCGCGGCH